MIVPLAYDWRGDVLEVVKHLHHTVTALRHQGVNRIGLVAHSMGRLIAAYYLRYGPQELDQAAEDWAGAAQMDAVVLAGVPYGGSMFTFRNMQYGRKIGLNKSLLSSGAVASFPSSYYILPSPDLDVLLSASLDPLRGMIYDSARWKENEWGLLRGSSGLSHGILSNRLDYTEYWLARAARLFHLVQAPLDRSGLTPVRTLSIIGQVGRHWRPGCGWDGNQRRQVGCFSTKTNSRRSARMLQKRYDWKTVTEQ